VGTSSARPDNLDDFSRRSRAADRELKQTVGKLKALHSEFVAALDWGHFDASSLLNGYRMYLGENEFDADWVSTIAVAFRAAGSRGGIARLPDAAIKASLRAAGLDRNRKSVTFDDPIAWGEPPTTGYTDDPINTATGNFVEVERDLVCAGIVASLSFSRTYNSRSDRVGPFGRGWASWATTRLLARADGVEYVGPDGQEVLFPRLGDGYGRVIGVSALVEPLESGLALSWFGSGMRWQFDHAGLPVMVTHGPGSEIRLSHDAAGRLVKLAHAGGKHVLLGWEDDSERIESLTCSDGRRTTYGYDEAGNLVAVDGGDAGTRRYEFDGDGRVESVIDADGVVELVNTYDDDGRVLEQLSPFGRRTHLSYLPGRVTVTTDDDEDGPVNTYVHDAAGRLLSIADGNDQPMSMGYDEWGNLAAVTERNGAVTIQGYDERARPVRRVLPTGVTVTFARDDADRLVEVAMSNGAVTRYSYTGDERSPSEILDAEGGITRQTVSAGLVDRIVDPDGVTTELTYDGDGNVVAVAGGDGQTARLEHDDAGRLTAAVSPLGRRRAFVHDAHGRVVERHDPGGGVWRFEHTAAGRLASITDPLGAREEIRYGEHGSPVLEVDALGQPTARDYDVFGNVIAVGEPGGARWEYSYDPLMRLIATTDPTGALWRNEYDVNGTLVATTDPVGVRQSAAVDPFGRVTGTDDGLVAIGFDLDELGRVVAERRPDGTQLRAEYDLCDRLTLLEDAAGAITTYAYTAAGRLAREMSPTGREEVFEYDSCGRLVARVDGAGRRWELRYDADGALLELHLPTGEVERRIYDEAGRLAERWAPGEGRKNYTYDLADRVVAMTDREAGTRRFEFDPGGRITAAVDANGARTRYEYDERGLLTTVVDPLGGTVTRRYDAAGRLTEITDQLGRTSTATYDAAGRLVEQVDASGQVVLRSYDRSGRVTSCGPPDAPVSIEYDGLGRAVAFNEPGSFSHRLRWDAEDRLVERRRGDLTLRWTYDADGERSAIGYPDGTETRYTRDTGGYVIGAQHPALGAIELQRDAAGRLVGASAEGMQTRWRYDGGDLAEYETRAGDRLRTAQLTRDGLGRVARATIDGAPHSFAYDKAGQLVAATTPTGPYAFAYDANGRLARETTPAGVATYEHDAAGQLLARTAGDHGVTRYEYDAAGRRVLEAGDEFDRRYEWDAFGRLTKIDSGGPDGAPRQVTKVGVDVVGELAEFDGVALLWDTADPLQSLAWDGERAVIGEGGPWALAGVDSAQWLAPDWQGTIGDAPRDPWGAVTGGMGAGAIGTGIALGYRGEIEFADDTWLRNRLYQPASRVFLGPDTMAPVPGTAAAADPYHYAANNPIGRADPLGLRPVTESELQKIRDGMDRNLLDHGRDLAEGYVDAQLESLKSLGEFAVKHADTISMVAGTLSLIPTPLSPFLGGVAVGASLIGAATALKNRDYAGAALNIVSARTGVKGVVKTRQARRMKSELKDWKAENKVGFLRGLIRRDKRRDYLQGLASRKADLSSVKAEAWKHSWRSTALTDVPWASDHLLGRPLTPVPWPRPNEG
jgi:RHS repeat-associated protein